MMAESDDHILLEVLREAQLDIFYGNLRQDLLVYKLDHFRHVKDCDLSAIGLSYPAIRRLREAIRLRQQKIKREKLLSKIKGRATEKPGASSDSLSAVDSTCLILRQQINLYETLGEGSFAVVKRGVWTQNSGKKVEVAVKLLKEKVADEELVKEVSAMHHLRHANLIRLFGVVIERPPMMVVELCSGGSLLDRLRSSSQPVLLVSQLLHFSQQIVCGMAYLAAKGCIHRDLAARNVLLNADETVAKICDFGLMRALRTPDEHYVMSGERKVPFAWCAPESLKFRQFSQASDVWMLGVTVWEIFSYGEQPWCGYSGPQILQQLDSEQRLPRPSACPPSVYELLRHCWALQPHSRPTFAALKALLAEIHLSACSVLEGQTGEGLLECQPGEQLLLIDGNADQYYWTAQSMRSRHVGKVARRSLGAVDGMATLSHSDISRPLKGSFLHTGHGDARGGDSWGEPGRIDEMFLRNPMPLLLAVGGSPPLPQAPHHCSAELAAGADCGSRWSFDDASSNSSEGAAFQAVEVEASSLRLRPPSHYYSPVDALTQQPSSDLSAVAAPGLSSRALRDSAPQLSRLLPPPSAGASRLAPVQRGVSAIAVPDAAAPDDPFEISTDVRDLMQRKSYSQFYAASHSQRLQPPLYDDDAAASGRLASHGQLPPSAFNKVKTASLPDVSQLTINRAAVLSQFDPLSSAASQGSPDTGDAMRERGLVERLRMAAPWADASKCARVLRRQGGDSGAAVEQLKLEKLVDLSLGSREQCLQALLRANWDMDAAASQLLG